MNLTRNSAAKKGLLEHKFQFQELAIWCNVLCYQQLRGLRDSLGQCIDSDGYNPRKVKKKFDLRLKKCSVLTFFKNMPKRWDPFMEK